ncbi:MAG: hypothetical protein ACP5HK_07370 [Acidilobus sp.]
MSAAHAGRASNHASFVAIASIALAAASLALPLVEVRGSLVADLFAWQSAVTVAPLVLLFTSSALLLLIGVAQGAWHQRTVTAAFLAALASASWSISGALTLAHLYNVGILVVPLRNEYAVYPSVTSYLGPSLDLTLAGSLISALASAWSLGLVTRAMTLLDEYAMSRFGVDFETLRRRFPGIARAVEVYARLSKGHGSQSTSYLARAARDPEQLRRVADREARRRFGVPLEELERRRPHLARALLEAARYMPGEEAT